MTLVFAAVMAVVLGATGVFVYVRFSDELDNTIDAGLRSRAGELAARVRQSGPHSAGHQHLVGRSDSFAEVVEADGQVADSSEAVGGQRLLSKAELQRALRRPVLVERGPLPGLEEQSRLLAVPVDDGGRASVAVVGTSIAPRDESLSDLLQLLLIGGPVALVLASLAAYRVATASLRPVEEMRARAAMISTAEADQRLPTPTSRDEIARLGETLNEMLDRLGEALARERSFVADASHELRTPLAILSAELELALAKGRSPEELRAALESAAEESDRLTQLSEDLLTIAQTERGELPLRIARVDLADALEGVRRRFARRADAEGRSIELDAPKIALDADGLRLGQAVGSIVDNALRYGSGEISLSAVDGEGVVEIRVVDQGPGFPPEFLGRAFERFSRASRRPRDGGSGLGLAIVRTVARAHGGEAHAANASGGGAEVWLTLPDRAVSSNVNQGRQ